MNVEKNMNADAGYQVVDEVLLGPHAVTAITPSLIWTRPATATTLRPARR